MHSGKREGKLQTETKTLVAADRVSQSDNCAAGDGSYKVFHRGNDRATTSSTIAIAISFAASRFAFAGRACL